MHIIRIWYILLSTEPFNIYKMMFFNSNPENSAFFFKKNLQGGLNLTPYAPPPAPQNQISPPPLTKVLVAPLNVDTFNFLLNPL